MTLARRSYTAAEELSLTTQVGGFCPLCDANLFSRKRSRDYKAFEFAHIYPLNPTPEEVEALRDVDQLHTHPGSVATQAPGRIWRGTTEAQMTLSFLGERCTSLKDGPPLDLPGEIL